MTGQFNTAQHAENSARLARLETCVDNIKDDIGELKEDVRPIKEAFLQARGFKAGFMALWLLVVASFGAIIGAVSTWFLGKH